MNQNSESSEIHPNFPAEMRITDPALVLILLHEKKREIIELLIKKAMTIQELKKATDMNPGTIKRHLDDLVLNKLVFVEKTERNEYNIRMKYYRATAQKFSINFSLPKEEFKK